MDPSHSKKIKQLAKKYGIDLVLLFGSAVRGKQHAKSDLDIAVLFGDGQDHSLKRYSKLLGELQEVFPDQKVDLSVINHADPLFLKQITDNCKLLFGASRRLQELRLYAFKRFQDHLPYFQMEERFVKRSLGLDKRIS